jgi:hypothetical protein
MSSSVSQPLVLWLEPDGAVLAGLATFTATAAVAVACTPLAAGVRLGLVLLIVGVTIWTALPQLLGHGRSALHRAVLAADGVWLLEFADGRRRAACLLPSTACLGSWWFLHWPGVWTVVTARGIGERDWRSLTARLRDQITVADVVRTASRHG